MNGTFRRTRCRICKTEATGIPETTLSPGTLLAYCLTCRKKTPADDLGLEEVTVPATREDRVREALALSAGAGNPGSAFKVGLTAEEATEGFAAVSRALARSTDPETSHEAAASLDQGTLRTSQQHVLNTLRKDGPMTDEKLTETLERWMSPSGARSRRAELVDRGMVEDSGDREILRSGRRGIVWKAVEP